MPDDETYLIFHFVNANKSIVVTRTYYTPDFWMIKDIAGSENNRSFTLRYIDTWSCFSTSGTYLDIPASGGEQLSDEDLRCSYWMGEMPKKQPKNS